MTKHRQTPASATALRCPEAEDTPVLEALFDRAFGPDRHSKGAYRLREGSSPILSLSRVMQTQGGEILGAALVWPVLLRCLISGAINDVLLFGPFAVDPARQGQRLGLTLLNAVMDAIDRQSVGPVFLVGDNPIYKRVGFAPLAPRSIMLPGGIDGDRVKVRDQRGHIRIPSIGELAPPVPERMNRFYGTAAE